MGKYEFQIIESVVLILVMLLISKVLRRFISKAGVRFSYHKSRIKIVKKANNLVLTVVVIIIMFLIWGIEPAQLFAYIASLLTVIGVAFFAQWSILSNITSTLIIFFNHQVNIGDTIVVLDKDYEVRGVISEIGVFFILVKLNENEYVSIPSNIFMQKMIKKIHSPNRKNIEGGITVRNQPMNKL